MQRIVIVTGGSQNIGLAIAERFFQEGTHVISADLNPPQNSSLGFVKTDVSSEASVIALMNYIEDQFGHLDVLVNNAGTIVRADACHTDDQQWQEVIDINLNGVFYFSRAVANQMYAGGVIINVSSTCGRVGAAGLAAYCASKGAVNMLTKTMALELAAQKINVNAVAPSAIKVPFFAHLNVGKYFFILLGGGQRAHLTRGIKAVAHPNARYRCCQKLAHFIFDG